MANRISNPSPLIAIIVLGAVLLVSVGVAAIRALMVWLLADTPPA
jgi:hypothetical protein